MKEILGILKSEGVKISDKSIYRILKEKTNNLSVASFDETFNESFGDDIQSSRLKLTHYRFIEYTIYQSLIYIYLYRTLISNPIAMHIYTLFNSTRKTFTNIYNNFVIKGIPLFVDYVLKLIESPW